MALNNIRLRNFRSYKDGSFEFSGGVNIIVGPNASGKTNLLEAVMFLCSGKSYRGADKELIAHGAEWMKLEGFFGNQPRVVSVENSQAKNTKTTTVNSRQYSRVPFSKLVPFVLFEPEHLQLLSGGPRRRREYLDGILEKVEPGYSKLLRDYQRALAQRNALLKQGQAVSRTMFVWDVRLSELGSAIADARQRYVERVNARLSGLYRRISKIRRNNLLAAYQTTCDTRQYASSLLKRLQDKIGEDKDKGFTSSGPHRDDLQISINSQPASAVASRGETRTITLCLKYIELETIEETRDEQPLLLLDDVFSELDGARRKALTEILGSHQAFITTTDADVILQHFTENCNIIPLNN